MKNSNDAIGNRTHDLPTCSAVPQPTAPPAACPTMLIVIAYLLNSICKYRFLMEMQRIFFEVGSEFLIIFR
jgi:hypothetical protein